VSKLKRFISIAIITIVAFFAFVWYMTRGDDQVIQTAVDRAAAISPSETEACVYSREMVRAVLGTPSTADFPYDACNAKVEGDTVTISSYVDAQDNFGAKLRTPYAWTGRYDPAAKKWKVDYFAMGDKIVIADGKPASP
jgi:hypothetical protein